MNWCLQKVVSYIPPEGLNLSCATFAYNNNSDEETRNDHCEASLPPSSSYNCYCLWDLINLLFEKCVEMLIQTYVIAGTEEGTVVAFNAETGDIIKGATAMVSFEEYSYFIYVGNEIKYYIGMALSISYNTK